MQNNLLAVANFLVYQELLDDCSLVSTELNDISDFCVFLDGSVAAKVLFKSLTNSLDVQVVGQAGNGCDTLATVSLLDTHVNLFIGRSSALGISGVFECVWRMEREG